MWKCTICKKENQDHVLRCQCGFDRSLDYEHVRSLVKLEVQDFQKYQKMKSMAQDTMKPKLEPVKIPTPSQEPKPTQTQPKIEPVKIPTPSPEPKTAQTQPKIEPAKIPTPSPEPKTAQTQPKIEPAKIPTPSQEPKPTQTQPKIEPPKTSQAQSVTPGNSKVSRELIEKSVFPKTKLDWLMLLMGMTLFSLAVWPSHFSLAYFFTSEPFCVPLGRFLDAQDWNVIIFIGTISYLLMNKSLGKIQYNKKRQWIFIYAVSSVLPLCYFGDVVWGLVMDCLGDSELAWEVLTADNLIASWVWLQIIIVLLAFFEDPAKMIEKRKARKAKRKARNMRIWPQTKLQTLVFAMGIALVVIFANRENWYYTVIDIEDIGIWQCVFIFWTLLYWLGKRLRYTYKFFKVVSYVYFSCLPLVLISDVVWSSDLLRPYAGENGAGWVLTFVAGWVLVFSMAIKEKQIKL